MHVVGFITIEPGETPKCPACGSQRWNVKQRIERESDLKRVDRFSDLVVEVPQQELYLQSLAMECLDCEAVYQPQPGVAAKLDLEGNKVEPVEAYCEGKEWLTLEGDSREEISGFEDGYGFPNQVGNDAEYSDEIH